MPKHLPLDPPFKPTNEQSREAKELWDYFSSIMESTCQNFETLEPFLRKAKTLFKDMNEQKISEYINYIILKGADAKSSEWDNIRCCLHLVFEPESGGSLTVDELREGKFETNRGRVQE